MLLITRDGLIVVFQNREIQILLLLVEHAREIDLRWYDLRPFGIPSSVSNNHIYRSSTISPDHLFEISIRIPELFIHSSRSFQDFFFYKNLFTSIHSNIFYRKRKKETEENDRFNFDAKWIKKFLVRYEFFTTVVWKVSLQSVSNAVTPEGSCFA